MDLPDLFPGFAAKTVDVGAVKLFARVGGPEDAPPVVLVHGFPQDHVMWHRVAPALARTHRVVVPDLRGYGWSTVPRPEPDHAQMSKRRMGEDIVALMQALGHVRFAFVGHDRGARVGYRLALDLPERLSGLAVLDIVPTLVMWDRMDGRFARAVYHWSFLAQPAPLPEMLIGKAARAFQDMTLASWTEAKDLSAFDPGALAHYHAFFEVPDRIAALCDDYRAGADIDLAHDRTDRAAGKRIAVPTLALWGKEGLPAKLGGTEGALAIWRDWATRAEGEAIDSGHFLAEENPAATLALLEPFLAKLT
jgi:haloacetate dehalogenase